MARGGKRPGAGRPKGAKSGKKSKTKVRLADGSEVLVEYHKAKRLNTIVGLKCPRFPKSHSVKAEGDMLVIVDGKFDPIEDLETGEILLLNIHPYLIGKLLEEKWRRQRAMTKREKRKKEFEELAAVMNDFIENELGMGDKFREYLLSRFSRKPGR